MNETKGNNHYTGLEVAVIGMACRFPGAGNVDEYWDNLIKGVESVRFFSMDELEEVGIPRDISGMPNYVPAMAILDDIESFDAGFFDYAPLEVGLMDPQMRLFHECCWQALEDAGYVPGLYRGLIGLYGGGGDSFHWKSMLMLSGKSQNTGVYELEQLSNKDYLCSRVAYKLDLKGPVVSVQTACSTSLVAIHMGYQALLSGESDIILAGGVSIIPFKTGYHYIEGMIKSPDGHCRAFDEKAQGFYAGNGGGVVVLKRLEEALVDGDNLYAIIKGSAINNDGQQKIGFTAPSVEAQSEVVKDALQTARVEIESIGYIETHGTGTPLGDPVELEALTLAYASDQKAFCGIGSVKTNFGHLDAAAGVAGFIKTVLILKHKLIPPILHFQSPNPKINFIDSPFYVVTDLTRWEEGEYPRCAGVSSLGLGGTNAHVILEEAPALEIGGKKEKDTSELIILSGRSKKVVERMSANLAHYLEVHQDLSLGDVAYTLQVGRKDFRFRRALVANFFPGVIDALLSENGLPIAEVKTGQENAGCVFVYPAHMGSDVFFPGIFNEFYQGIILFREAVDETLTILKPVIGYNLKRYWEDKRSSLGVDVRTILQVIFQYALSRVFIGLGIQPRGVMGRGMGEIVAAHLAGVMSLTDALHYTFAVGQVIKQGGENYARENHPVENYKFPSGLAEIFKRKVERFSFQSPRIRYYGGINTVGASGFGITDAGYWLDLGRFFIARDGVEFQLPGEEPGLNLLLFGQEPRGSSGAGMIPLVSQAPAYPGLLEVLGRLWQAGFTIDWTVMHQGQGRRRVSLPTYCFEKQRFPIEGSPYKYLGEVASELKNGLKIIKEPDISQWFYFPAWKRSQALGQVQGSLESLSRGSGADDETWLIFRDEIGLGQSLEMILTGMNQRVITVTMSNVFGRDPGGRFYIDSREPGHYHAMFQELMDKGIFPTRIFHLWNLNRDSHDQIGIERFYEYQYRGFYSMLLLASELNRFDIEGEVQVNVVTAHLQDVTGNEEICPELTPVMGAVKVIPQEYPYIICRIIDVELPGVEMPWDVRVSQQLITEFFEPGFEPVIAFRGNYRWVQSYDRVILGEAKPKLPILRPDGVYLVNGGLGNIGFVLARYLVEQVNARVILVSRSGVPGQEMWDSYLESHGKDDRVSEKILKLKQLEAMGAKYRLKLADVGNLDEMKRVVEEVEAEWGPIKGVFHAAGETDTSIVCMIDRLNEETVKRQFQARVFGLMVLERLLKERQPDFCVVVSSLVTVLGGLGFAAYGAAIVFMDAIAHYGNRENRFPWLSIGTAEWMFKEASTHVIQSGIAGEMLELSMTVAEGLETFKRVLSHCSRGQVVVSTGNLDARVDKWVKLKTLHATKAIAKEGITHYPRPDLSTAYATAETPDQVKMIMIWQDFFAVEPVGIDDNFFELGGDSLKVITLVSTIHKEFHVKLSIETFFSFPTIRGLTASIGATDKETQDIYMDILPVEKKEYYPLSSAQKRIYFLQQMDLNSTGYNSKFVQFVGNFMEREHLEETLKKLILRHESLRTSFHVIDEVPVQIVHDQAEFALEYHDIEKMMAGVEGEEWYRLVDQVVMEFFRPFDLGMAPLFRSGLVRLPDGNHFWLWDMHHIVSDGTSHTIITEDVISLYRGRRPAALKIQYKDFSEWQNWLFEKGVIKAQEEYWMKLYADTAGGDAPRLDLATDFKRPALFSFAGASVDFRFGKEEAVQFRALGQKNGGTFYMNILAALNTLFFKYTGQTDTIIGSAIAGRPHLDLQPIVGMFVNTLAMRNHPGGNKTYEGFLKEVISTSIQAFENQDVQFEELVERLDLDRDPSRNPLFDVIMVVQNYRQVERQEESSTGQDISYLDKMNIRNTTAKFDMTFFVYEEGEDANIIIEYYTAIYKPGTIQRLISHFRNVVAIVSRDPGICLQDIELISDKEKQEIIEVFNGSRGEYPRDKSIYELFGEQVEKNPDQVAVVSSGGMLTYRELADRSDEVSGYIIRWFAENGERYGGLNIGVGRPVGILMEKCVDMVAVVLGILKSGAAYMPIGPAFPQERMKMMIDDGDCPMLISQKRYIKLLNRLQWECRSLKTFLCLDSQDIYNETEVEQSELMGQKLWEYVGERAVDEITGGGWLSSYTGEPIPKEEMDEYGDNILEKLLPLLNKKMRVLEIGCASGISMFRLARHVGLYYGTDLSGVIIERNQARIKAEGLHNIKLKRLAAHELDKLEENGFDLVIINSVIQCFHGHNYFRQVMARVIKKLSPQGYIFLGDLMDQDQKTNLVNDLTAFKRSHRDQGYKTKTDWSTELFISRDFLEDLCHEIPALKDVQFSDKIYTIENELTRYRFDALFTVDKTVAGKSKSGGIKGLRHKCQHDSLELKVVGREKPPLPGVDGNTLAYIMYTSGSTGAPKGVMVEHHNVVRLVQDTAYVDFRPDDRIAQGGVLEFDASTFEIWGALLNGLMLYLVEKEVLLSYNDLKQYLHRGRVSIMFMTTALFNQLVQVDTDLFSKLRYLLVGGEVATAPLFNRVVRELPGLKFIHCYGPTENTTFSTTGRVERQYDYNIPIGGPITNSTIHVLDGHYRLQPVGVVGELWVGGEGVARGYMNNPELTAEKFVSLRINDQLGDKLYRTGDLGRWNEEGCIEFYGRMDQQVKVRGFRIELGEIQGRLLQCDLVEDAIVIDRLDNDNTRYLVGYVVLKREEREVGQEESHINAIRDFLGEVLPDYMIPAFFIVLERIPLNPNGKVDRKALPEPTALQGEHYVAPTTEIEIKLAAIWAEVLNIGKVSGGKRVGIDDNFFDLGGHSLKATVLAARIHKELDVKIPLAEIFRGQTIRSLAEYIKGAGEDRYAAIMPVEKKEYYPLSSAQKRVYFIQQMDPTGAGYNIPMVVPLGQEIDRSELEWVFKQLIGRHESLRTSFIMIDGEPVQWVHDYEDIAFSIEEYGIETGQEFAIHRDFVRAFDLADVPLLRAGLLALPGNGYLLMVDMHHIISDGTSHTILTEDFLALAGGKTLKPLRIQYRDYSSWQNWMIAEGGIETQVDYWLGFYAGIADIPRLNLPTDFKRPGIFTFRGSNYGLTLDSEVATRFRTLGSRCGATLYMNVLTALNTLFYKYTGQEDIIIGTGSAGRPHADLLGIIGMFINTLAMRNHPAGNKTYEGFLKEVATSTVKAFENQDVQLEELVEKLDIMRDTSRNPLFDISLIVQNFRKVGEGMDDNNQWGAAESRLRMNRLPGNTGVEFINTAAKFDITFYVYEFEHDIHIDVEYYTGIFKEETVARMTGHLQRVIERVGRDSYLRLKEIDILGDDEKQLVVETFNTTGVGFDLEKTVVDMFNCEAEQHPDRVAVTVPWEHTCMTYGELQEYSNRLGFYLQQNGAGAGTIVGLMTNRSLDMMIGILGILKSGAAYLPIIPAFPVERILFMLEDSAAVGLVSNMSIVREKETLGQWQGKKFYLDNDQWYGDGFLPGYGGSETSLPCPGDLGYVIYTSGTTGLPKGVMINHHSLSNFLHTFFRDYNGDFGQSDRCLGVTHMTFDVSVGEFFLPLCSGGGLVIAVNEEIMDVERLSGIILAEAVTYMYMHPSLLSSLCSSLKTSGALLGLNKMLVGVEPIIGEVLHGFLELKPGLCLINAYGPTETTITATGYRFNPETVADRNVPIGRPMANVRVYILDRDENPVPVMVWGALFIGGVGVGRGYLNRPALTAERFVQVCLSDRESGQSERLYKTGDLGRWHHDGNIEFLGRADQQVKIRGYRIELGEIEAHLVRHKDIREAVVIAREANDGIKFLCAYVTLSPGCVAPGNSNLKQFLTKNLPDYMVPAHFIILDHIPLTAHGKVNRKALPEPDAIVGDRCTFYAAPRTNLEKLLVETWSTVLTLEPDRIGIDSNFFELGGHSIKATILTSLVKKTMGVKVPVAEIFKHPTIRGLSLYIESIGVETVTYSTIEPVEKQEYYAMSSAQRRIYFIQQMNPKSTAYHMPQVIPLAYGVEKSRLEHIFKRLVDRHEALRTSFIEVNGEPVQEIHDHVEFEIVVIPVVGKSFNYSRFIRPFNLAHAPLMRAALVCGPVDSVSLIVDMHHIITDGTSQAVLLDDFLALSLGRGLPALTIQYKDFSQWQNRSLAGRESVKQDVYWLEMFADAPYIPRVDLPTDAPRPEVFTFKGNLYSFFLEPENAAPFKELGMRYGATLFMNMLALLDVFLYRYSNQDDIVVGCGIAGRPHADLQRVIGMFVNILPMRNRLRGNINYLSFLKTVIQDSIEAFENQDMQFEMLVEQLSLVRDPSRNPLFDISLVVQNFADMKTFAARGSGSMAGEKAAVFGGNAAKFDMTFSVMELENDIRIDIEYYSAIFRSETIQRMARHFKQMVAAVSRNPLIELDSILMLDEEEKQAIIDGFNNTRADYPKNKTIDHLIHEQVERTPGKIAVVLEVNGSSLTYSELHHRAMKLGVELKNRGVENDTIVAIMMERSIELIIGIMGILYAGGAYLPIDPEYPAERIGFILADSATRLLLTDGGCGQKMQKTAISVAWIDISTFEQDEKARYNSLSGLTGGGENPGTLAYVIYTSGTTGLPKGTLVQHSSLVNMCWWHLEYYCFKASDRLTQYAGIGFDASVWEIFVPLVGGIEFHILGSITRMDILALKRYYNKARITAGFLPTRFCRQFMEEETEVPSLRLIITGGEKLERVTSGRDYRLYNNYGPTENTVVATACLVEEGEIDIPIGKPVHNNIIYIIDRAGLRLQAIGVPGEILIGGDSVCRGYLNNPGLTFERFIQFDHKVKISSGDQLKESLPINENDRSSLGVFSNEWLVSGRQVFYKTGDLGRWRADGNIQYLGRVDQQVKIRGFRIEPGEIEQFLIKTGLVQEVVVLPVENNQNLCAYIVLPAVLPQGEGFNQGAGEISLVLELKRRMAERLPAFMVPTYIVFINEIPLTTSGKLNRAALPGPEKALIEGYVAPRDEMEKQLAVIWARVLGMDNNEPGIDHNFFELGGHSLKATQVVAEIYREFGVQVPLAQLFTAQTIRGLAGVVRQESHRGFVDIEPVPLQEYYELSFNQRRIWIIQQHERESNAFNIPDMIMLVGTETTPLDELVIGQTVNILALKHESLRTGFKEVDGEAVQYILPGCSIPLDIENLVELDPGEKQERLTRIIDGFYTRSFRLDEPPLFRTLLVKVEQELWIFVYNMHHIVSDGWSMKILERDFQEIYQGCISGRAMEVEVRESLPLLTYKDFAAWQSRQLADGPNQESSRRFWVEMLKEDWPVLRLPGDSEGYKKPRTGAGYKFFFPATVKETLNQLSLENNVTLFSLLYAVYNVFLAGICGQRTVVSSILNAGRDHPSLHNIVGFFVNPVLFKYEVDMDGVFIEFVRGIQEKVHEFFRHQGYPLELVLDEAGRTYPEVTASFNLLNIGDTSSKEVEITEPVHSTDIGVRIVKYDLEPVVREFSNGIEVFASYNGSIIKVENIEYMMKRYREMVEFFAANPGKKLSEFKETRKRKSFKRN